MSHYFEDIAHTKDDYFTFEDVINGQSYLFESCNNVFSKSSIDYGTKVLLNTILNSHLDLGNTVLDIGCGYGAIGIVLANYYKNTQFLLSDITSTAVELSRKNILKNHIRNAEVVQSDLFQEINETFDAIVTNPPIKVGKQVLLNLIDGAYEHLNQTGCLILVIKKSHGKDSIKQKLETVFGNCEVLQREKGYYILKSEKSE